MVHSSLGWKLFGVGFVAFALTFAGSLPAAAQQSLVLADGDQLTGALKSASPDTWIFTFRGQDVEIATADIASFTAPEPIGLRLSDNSIVAATVSPVTDGLELVLADGTSRTVTPADFEATGSPDDLEALQEVQLGYFTPFSKFWALSASLGASTRSGNTESSSLNARLDVDRATERDRLALAFLATEEQTRPPDGDSKEQTAQKFIGNIRADIFPWTRVFLFGENRYTRDRFADIDLRVNLNLGSGIQITKTDKTDIRAALGLGGRYENFTSDAESETVGTMNVNGQWNQKFGGFEFSTALDVTPALQDFNDYQLLSDSNLTATLIAGFGFRVGLLVQYDNTPAPGLDTTDTTLITALNYNLGR